MYARNVKMNLKPNTANEFSQTLERDIMPMLRKQSGFADELSFVSADGKGAMTISLWDRKESADTYNRDTYPAVLKGLARVIDGTPEVSSFNVASSTLHKLPALAK